MFKIFFPQIIFNSVQEIDFDFLRSRGIKGLIFDIDNTLVKPNEKQLGDKVLKWLKELEDCGFRLCILSNSGKRRSLEFSGRFSLNAIHGAGKPLKKGFLKTLKFLGLERSEVCMIGDQLFTDVLGANRLGIYSVCTRPITTDEPFTVKLKRPLERLVFRAYHRAERESEREI